MIHQWIIDESHQSWFITKPMTNVEVVKEFAKRLRKECKRAETYANVVPHIDADDLLPYSPLKNNMEQIMKQSITLTKTKKKFMKGRSRRDKKPTFRMNSYLISICLIRKMAFHHTKKDMSIVRAREIYHLHKDDLLTFEKTYELTPDASFAKGKELFFEHMNSEFIRERFVNRMHSIICEF